MDPIKPLNGLAELLRKRIASEVAGKQAGRASAQAPRSSPAGGSQRAGVDVLRAKISNTVRAIDPDDPSWKGKATRAFIENVLAWQFGDSILNDPKFADLVTNVQTAFENDRAVGELLDAIVGNKMPTK